MTKIRFNNEKLLKTIGNILVAIAIVFLIKRYIDLGINISDYINGNLVIKLVPVILAFSALISIQFIPWAYIVKAITDASPSMTIFYKVFQRANIMKYIPGNIFQYIGRAEIIQEKEGLNVANIATSVLIENGALLIASLLLGFCGIRDYMIRYLTEHRPFFGGMLIAVVVTLMTVFFLRTRIQEWAKKKGVVLTKRLFAVTGIIICFFFVSMLIQAFLQIFVIHLLSRVISMEMLLLVGGAYAVSWLAGYITPGASGGIGVREALFCIILEKYLASDIVIVSVIVFRAINIIADIIAYATSILIIYLFNQHTRIENNAEL